MRGMGLTTTVNGVNNEQAEKPSSCASTRTTPLRTPSTSSEDDDEEDVEEQQQRHQQWTPTDLTSVGAPSERYSDIIRVLSRQKSPTGQQQQHPGANWAMADGYDLSAYNQINGVWPLGHPLPLPDWGSADEPAKDTLVFENVWQYEELNGIVETALQRMLEETHYNTVNLFVDFYRSFKRTRRSDLRSFFQFYDVPINRRHHMCVSLAFEIIARLVQMFPQLGQYLCVVSCEEQVVDCNDYVQMDEEYGMNSADAGVEKEHVMVAMRFAIGERRGVMILDPGYHVGRAVTIMCDQSYPHTGKHTHTLSLSMNYVKFVSLFLSSGWFNQSKEPHLQRDYCYSFSQHSEKFVEWKEREIRGDEASFKTSLIYIAQEYITAVDVTVRRNLVYNFRSLLSRDAKGRVYAGLYFPLVANVQEAHLTLFYDGPNEQRVKAKLMFSAFKVGKGKVSGWLELI